MGRNLRTRVYEIREAAGYDSDLALARAMDLSQKMVSAVRTGYRNPGPEFIVGAFKAFPHLTFEQLFYYEPAETREPAEVAS